MSAPRTKRQFAGAATDPSQRQITSFFPSVDHTSLSFPEAAAAAPYCSRPVLPADTQSNLLNVGMRVRKSVPEGYKTGTYSAMGLFKDLDSNPTTEHVKNNSPPPQAASSSPTPRLPPTTSQRELLPFCGINKIGGLSAQPAFTFESLSPPSIDDVPALSSSQHSIKSTGSGASARLSVDTSRTSTARKRVHDDGDESDTPSVSDCLQVPSGEWMDGQVSPRSLVPAGWENTRVMAVPRKMRQQTKQQQLKVSAVNNNSNKLGHNGSLDQENMVVDEDFPEADFLDYRALDDRDMDF